MRRANGTPHLLLVNGMNALARSFDFQGLPWGQSHAPNVDTQLKQPIAEGSLADIQREGSG